nr:hypothetical protein [Tanacetum cinerariifolium]
MNYKAVKVCHEEMVKMPLMDLKVLDVRLHEVKGGARVAFEDEFRAAEESEVSCKAQQGRSRVKRKLFESFRNKMGNVRTLIMEEAHATKYYVRPGVIVGILTFRKAEIGESKMIGLELEQEMNKVVVIKERLKEAKDRQES